MNALFARPEIARDLGARDEPTARGLSSREDGIGRDPFGRDRAKDE
jgi:hypothetical protein